MTKDVSSLPTSMHRPKREPVGQETLFAHSATQVLMELGISRDDLAYWANRGWLTVELGMYQRHCSPTDPWILEAVFVRDVVRSGLPEVAVSCLLEHRTRLSCPDPELAAFSFRHGWFEPRPIRVTDLCIDDVRMWLRMIPENDLRTLQGIINDRIEDINEKQQRFEALQAHRHRIHGGPL